MISKKMFKKKKLNRVFKFKQYLFQWFSKLPLLLELAHSNWRVTLLALFADRTLVSGGCGLHSLFDSHQ